MVNKYWKWLAEHYDEQKEKLTKYCHHKHMTFDEDIFSDTLTKVAEKIQKKGIKDDTDKGFENYLFKSFKINTIRDKQYSRNAKRDDNQAEAVNELWESWYNEHHETEDEKLIRDLKKDFSILYLSDAVIQQFGEEICHLFLTKYYYQLTYKQLSEKYKNIPKLRDKLLEVKRYLQENVTKEDINQAFWQKYGNLIN